MSRIKDVSIMKKLIRIMTGPLSSYKRQHTQKLQKKYYKQIQTDAPWNKQFGEEFQKDSFAFDALRNLSSDQYEDRNKLLRYIEFEAMEFTPEVAATLNIIATEMTTGSSIKPVLNITCKKPAILEILKSFYYDTLAIESNAFGWARNMIKYGDYYLYLDIDKELGITGTKGIHPKEVKRIEGLDAKNPNYYKFELETTHRQVESYEIMHIRNKGDERYGVYGTSALEGARRIVRMLTLLEDNAMGYRIVRSPERRVFYIDVTTIPDEKIKEYMEKLKTSLKRSQVINATTGVVNERFNPPAIDEDYYIPIKGKNQTKIDTLQGGQYNGAIDDLKYFQNKLFTVLMVPQDYLSYEKGGGGDKALSEKNIYFAGQVLRFQQCLIETLAEMGRLHLVILGYKNEDLLDWEISFNNPSKIAEMQELEAWKTKISVASSAGLNMETFFPKRWICEKFFGIGQEEFERMQLEIEFDKRFEAKMEALAKGVGGEGGAAGDAMGAAADAGMEAAAENGGEPGLPEESEAPEKDSMLLAAPGRRSTTKPHLSQGAKNHPYTYTNHDQRDLGGNIRHSINGLGGAEKASSSMRNLGLKKLSESEIDRILNKIKKTVTDTTEIIDSSSPTDI